MDKQFSAVGPESLAALWAQVCEKFVEKVEGMGLSECDFDKVSKDILESLSNDYNDHDNHPTINNVELEGDLTFEDLGFDIELQRMLDAMNPAITSKKTEAFNADVFGEGTTATYDVVNRMVTVRMTIVIPKTEVSPIENYTPQLIFTETLPPASDDAWQHLGRYTDAENTALEFAVDTDGILTMTSMGQIPNGRSYNIVFTYLAA